MRLPRTLEIEAVEDVVVKRMFFKNTDYFLEIQENSWGYHVFLCHKKDIYFRIKIALFDAHNNVNHYTADGKYVNAPFTLQDVMHNMLMDLETNGVRKMIENVEKDYFQQDPDTIEYSDVYGAL